MTKPEEEDKLEEENGGNEFHLMAEFWGVSFLWLLRKRDSNCCFRLFLCLFSCSSASSSSSGFYAMLVILSHLLFLSVSSWLKSIRKNILPRDPDVRVSVVVRKDGCEKNWELLLVIGSCDIFRI